MPEYGFATKQRIGIVLNVVGMLVYIVGVLGFNQWATVIAAIVGSMMIIVGWILM